METLGNMREKTKAEREAGILAHLVENGYARAEPAVLQPSAVFFDLSGEDIRGRIFLTTDSAANEFCLRPEYTIPVCREYLSSPQAGSAANFSYLGPVFRQRANGPAEFYQAGIESLGRQDREAADAETFSLAIEAASTADLEITNVTIGDAGLLNRLLEGLEIDAVWLRRIKRGIIRHLPLSSIFASQDSRKNSNDHSGVLAALQGVDRRGAQALVEDLLSIAGITSTSGRSASDIAERYLEQASKEARSSFNAEKRQIIESYLEISGDPDTCSTKIRALASDSKLDIDQALDEFDARTGFIAARGFDLSLMEFSAGFARNLDYYTGFVFEAFSGPLDAKPVVGGGRYDGLLKALGAASDIPAVGASIWCDRIPAGAGKRPEAGP